VLWSGASGTVADTRRARNVSASRAQVQDLLHVPPAAFDLEELLVAQRDVGGREVRVRAAQQVLPVQVGLGLAPGLVDAQQPAGGDPQVPVQAASTTIVQRVVASSGWPWSPQCRPGTCSSSSAMGLGSVPAA
jgi:hypothetical protein